MAISRQLGSRIAEMARGLVLEQRSQEGQEVLAGKRFIEMEDEACEVADALAAEVIRLQLEQQAAQVPPEKSACCPACGRAGRREPPEPRRLQTRRGEVGWEEPKFYCLHCRKSFFPSV